MGLGSLLGRGLHEANKITGGIVSDEFDAVTHPIGVAIDATHLGDVASAGVHAVADVAKTVGGAAMGALNAFNEHVDRPLYSNLVSQPLSAAAITATGVNPIKAWGQAQNVSPGQAIPYALAHDTHAASSALGVPDWVSGQALTGLVPFAGPLLGAGSATLNATGVQSQLADPSFDITDEADQKQVFSQGWGKYISGLTDAEINWNLDPLVVVGKGVKVARAGQITVEGATRFATRGKTGEEAMNAIDQKLMAKGSVNRLADDITSRPAGQRMNMLSRNPTTSGTPGLNGILDQIEGQGPELRDKVLKALAYSHNPTAANRVRLEAASAETKNQIDTLLGKSTDLQRELDRYPLITGPDATKYPAWVVERNASINAAKTAELEEVTRQYSQLGKQWDIDKALQKIADDGMTGKLVPRVTVGNRLEVATRWANYQPGRLAVPMRVLKSATSNAPDEVKLGQPGHDVEMAKRALDRTGHAFPIIPTEQRTLGQKLHLTSQGIDDATKNRLLGSLAAAKTPEEKIARLQDVETTIFHHNARLAGSDLEFSQALLDELRSMQTVIGKQTVAGSPDAAHFSGVANPKLPGHTLDQFLDEEGVLARNHLLTTQAPNTYTLMPLEKLAHVMRQEAWAFRSKENQARLLSLAKGQDAYTLWRTAGVDQVFGRLTQVMTTAQLLRGGYIIRNNTDQGFRMLALQGAMVALGNVAKSVGGGVRGSLPGTIVRDYRSKASRREAADLVEQLTGAKKLADARASIVDKLAGYQQARAALAPQIQEAEHNLRLLGQASQDERVYLQGPAGAQFKPGTKFTINPPTAAPANAAHTTHERHINADWRKIYETESGHADPGIAALSEFTNEARFNELGTMPVAKLRETISADFPTAKLGSKRNRDDLLSAYGHELAKRRGHEAIRHTDIDGTETFTDLTGNATRAAADDELIAAHDKWQRLNDQRDLLAWTEDELTGLRDGLGPEWTDRMNSDLGRYSDQAMTARKRRSLYGKERAFSGDEDIHILMPNGQVVAHSGPFAGALGRANMDLTSNRTAQRGLTGVGYKYTQGIRTKAGNAVTLEPTAGDRVGLTKKLYEKSYRKGYETAVNRQIALDPIGQRILQGQTDDEIEAWLRNTDEGRGVLERRPQRNNSPRDWVGEARQQVDAYLPTPELRAAALEGRATFKLLEKVYPHALDRPTVHGESLNHALGEGSLVGNLAESVREKFFDQLAGGLTDTLTNHPYANGVFHSELEYAYRNLKLAPGEMVTPEMSERIHNAALRNMQTAVKTNMYDLTSRSNLSAAMRFMSPYYTAWQEAITTWSKLFLQDPSRFERLMQLYQAPSKAGYVHTDANGHKHIVTPLPPSMKSAFAGLFSGDLPLDAVTGTIAQGKYWFLPSAGAPVSIPVGVLVRKRPELAKLLEPIVPFGVGKDVVDDVLPSWARRARSGYSGDDDVAYGQALIRNNIDLTYEHNIGQNDMTPAEIHAEAQRRTDEFFKMRMAANLLYPAAPTFSDPKYQYYYDQATTMRAQYAAFAQRTLGDGTHRNQGEDDNGKRWEEAYTDKFGQDFYVFTASASKSNVGGIAPTIEGIDAIRKYRDMIASNPEYGSLIVGDEDNGAYDPEALQWQQTNEIAAGAGQSIRSAKTPDEAIDDAQIAQGWDKYRMFNTAVTTLLASRGLKSINAKAAEDIKAAKANFVSNLATDFPAWYEKYGTFDSGKSQRTVGMMETLVNDPRTKDRAGYQTLTQYLAMRKNMQLALAGRTAKTLDAKENTDLAGAWENFTGGLVEKDPSFADLYYRWLENDKIVGSAT